MNSKLDVGKVDVEIALGGRFDRFREGWCGGEVDIADHADDVAAFGGDHRQSKTFRSHQPLLRSPEDPTSSGAAHYPAVAFFTRRRGYLGRSMDAAADFRAAPESVAAARDFLREHLERWEIADLADAAVIVLSEIAANVVRHAQTDYAVLAAWCPPTLRVDVRNGSTVVPAIRDFAGEEGGFGLRMVDTLADEWGIERYRDGKSVWFTLERPA
jgi:anti-sigma regulatory factor (Ser/Thr protein kinase)